MSRIYGYVRVSSRDQNEARQMAAMHEAGVSDKDIYLDKRSGADFERQGYCRMIRRIKAGDTLVVKSIDRLGRNYDEILEQWRFITREKRASILVLDMPLLDTRQSRGAYISDGRQCLYREIFRRFLWNGAEKSFAPAQLEKNSAFRRRHFSNGSSCGGKRMVWKLYVAKRQIKKSRKTANNSRLFFSLDLYYE